MGLCVGERPYVFLAATLLLTAVSSGGFLFFYEKNDVREDYSPDDAPSKHEFDVASEFFKDEGLPYLAFTFLRAKDGGDLLRKDHLKEVIDLEEYLFAKLPVNYNNTKHYFKDLCGTYCSASDAIRFFITTFYDREYVKKLKHVRKGDRLTYPEIDVMGDKLYIGENIFGVTLNQSTDEIRNASVINFNFRANIGDSEIEAAITEWEFAMFDLMEAHCANESALVQVVPSSQNIVTQEIRGTGMAAMPYLPLSFLVILTFTIFTELKTSTIKSKPFAAIAGVFCPIMAIITSFGILLYFRTQYLSLVTVAPFLILAVGVDDVYIALHAWHRTADDFDDGDATPESTPASSTSALRNGSTTKCTPLPPRSASPSSLETSSVASIAAIRTARTLEDAGPSITITSLTNALSFFVGTFTPTPAVRIFCIYTGAAVVAAYLYQLFYFTAIIALDGRRETARRNAYLPCRRVAAKENAPPKCSEEGRGPKTDGKTGSDTSSTGETKGAQRMSFKNRCNHLVVQTLAHLYVKNWLRVLTVVLLVCYWTVSIIGLSRMKVQLSADKLFLQESIVAPSPVIQKEFIFKHSGTMYLVVNRPGDLRDRERLGRLMEMVDRYETHNMSSGPVATRFWFRDYSGFDNIESTFTRLRDGSPLGPAFSYTQMNTFLRMNSYTKWKHYLNVGSYNDCREDRPECIPRMLIRIGFRGAVEWNDRSRLLNEWRRMAEDYSALNVTIFEEWSMYADQVDSIGPVTKQSVLISLASMAVVCAIFIPNPVSVVCATLSVMSINLGVLGLLSVWGVDLDPMSMATVLMSVGFSVDFTAHMSYHFYRGDYHKRSERLYHALSAVMLPMLQAGTSTVLAVVVLLLVPAYMVRVFVKTVFLVVMLGLVHGLYFLPVLLSVLPYHNNRIFAVGTATMRDPKPSQRALVYDQSSSPSSRNSSFSWKRQCRVQPLSAKALGNSELPPSADCSQPATKAEAQ